MNIWQILTIFDNLLNVSDMIRELRLTIEDIRVGKGFRGTILYMSKTSYTFSDRVKTI